MGFAHGRQGGKEAGWSAVVGVAAVLLLSGRARADEALSVETLTTLKAATVFLKVEGGKGTASGSGFVIKTEGQTVHVVTNNHVIDLTPEGQPRPGTLNPTVTVVFNSGGKDEQSARGEVVAADVRRDLAVVKVANVKNPPLSIDLAQPVKLQETMPVYILGFPLGELLATNKGNPAITVGKGSVASLRYNERGELATVQIDGDMTPGNSGGPVVDSKGRLVGVTAATIRGRRIGFAIPAGTLTQVLKGRLLDHHFVTRRAVGGSLDVRVELGVFDPFNQLKGVSFYYLPGGKPADKKLTGLPNVQKVDLERSSQLLAGNFTLRPAEIGDVKVSFQAVYADGDNHTFVTAPRERSLPRGGGGPPPPPAEPVVQAPPQPTPPSEPRGKTTIDLLSLIDPAKDVVHGKWEIKDNVLVATQMIDWQRIEVPYRPPEEYDFVVVFSQPKLRMGSRLILPNPKGGSFTWEIGGNSGRRFYLSVNGAGVGFVNPNFLEANTVYTTVVQVRRDSVCCLINGKELVNRKTDFRDLTTVSGYGLRDATLLGLCGDATVYHYVRLVEITGKGNKVR